MGFPSEKNKTVIKKVSISSVRELQRLCKQIYPIYFGDYWEADGLAVYMEDQFGIERLSSDLRSEKVDYFFIYQNDEVVGFLKLIYETLHKKFDRQRTSELEKIYIAPGFVGKGIGRMAMLDVIKLLYGIGKKALILDVLDTNLKGIAFYEKFGFELHCKTRLTAPNFKDQLRGLHLMHINIRVPGGDAHP